MGVTTGAGQVYPQNALCQGKWPRVARVGWLSHCRLAGYRYSRSADVEDGGDGAPRIPAALLPAAGDAPSRRLNHTSSHLAYPIGFSVLYEWPIVLGSSATFVPMKIYAHHYLARTIAGITEFRFQPSSFLVSGSALWYGNGSAEWRGLLLNCQFST